MGGQGRNKKPAPVKIINPPKIVTADKLEGIKSGTNAPDDGIALPVVFGTAQVPAITVTKWDYGGDPPGVTARLALCQGPVSGYWRIWRDKTQIPSDYSDWDNSITDGAGKAVGGYVPSNSQSLPFFNEYPSIARFLGYDTSIKLGQYSLLGNQLKLPAASWEFISGNLNGETSITKQTLTASLDLYLANTSATGSAWTYGGAGQAGHWQYNYTGGNRGSPRKLVSKKWIEGPIHPYPIPAMTSSEDVCSEPGRRPILAGVAHIRATRLRCPSGEQLPQLYFEVRGFDRSGSYAPATYDGYGYASNLDDDANPADVLTRIWTDTSWGLGFSTATLDVDLGTDGFDSSGYRKYCQAAGFYVSRAIMDFTDPVSLISELLDETNAICFWSEGKLKVRPLGDQVINAHSATFIPNNTAYVIDHNELLHDDNPVQVFRGPDSEVFNTVPVIFSERTPYHNSYRQSTVEYTVQADAANRGIRRDSAVTLNWVKRREHAYDLAQIYAQRAVYQRNTYKFRLGPRWSLLEPGDLLSLTEPVMGLSGTIVRVQSTDWSDDGSIFIEAMERPNGIGTSTDLTLAAYGQTPDFNRNPIQAGSDRTAILETGIWESFDIADNCNWTGICEMRTGTYNGRVLAVGKSGTTAFTAVSDDGGKRWNINSSSLNSLLVNGVVNDCFVSGAKFFATGETYTTATFGRIASSSDGLTWSSVHMSTYQPMMFGRGAVSDDTGAIVVCAYPSSSYSTDGGSTWNNVETKPSGTTGAADIAWGSGTFVITGFGAITSSDDGATWSNTYPLSGTGIIFIGAPRARLYKAITYHKGIFMTVGGPADGAAAAYVPGALCSVSRDLGATWEFTTVPFSSSDLWAVGENADKIVVAGDISASYNGGDMVLTTYDAGITWTQTSLSTDTKPYDITAIKGKSGNQDGFMTIGFPTVTGSTGGKSPTAGSRYFVAFKDN
jgi:hypothetical protein